MIDFTDELFSDLDDYYPGSKRKRKSVKTKEDVIIEPKTWDARPYKKTMPNGQDMELFTIGALADALGRPIITVRDWVKKGYLPTAPYRMPSKPNKNGDEHLGRRLYSRAMVESAIQIFNETGLSSVQRINWSQNKDVAFRISETWNTIRVQETNANNANTE